MGNIMGGGSSGGGQSNYQYQGTTFPFQFASDAADLGYPQYPISLYGGPQLSTTNMFGQPVTVGSGAGGQGMPPTDVLLGPERELRNGEPVYTLADLEGSWSKDPQKRQDIERLQKRGYIDYSKGFTASELQAAIRKDKDLSGRSQGNFSTALADLDRRYNLEEQSRRAADWQNSQQDTGGTAANPAQAPGQPAQGNEFNPFAITQGNVEQMFGQGYQAPDIQTPQISYNPINPSVGQMGAGSFSPAAGAAAQGFSAQGYVPTAGQAGYAPQINAPTVEAAQMNIAPEGFEEYQRALYESQFRPVERDLSIEQQQQDRQLQERLAATGLSSSPAGLSILSEQNEAFGRQLLGAMQDAANNASVQRFGAEFNQAQNNAGWLQEARLANANFDLAAQTSNAANILQANLTNAQLSTQASIAGAQNMTSASIASAQNRTQASIATAQNMTQASIANADASSRIAIANADAATRVAIANGQLGLEAQRLQGAMYLETLGLKLQDANAYRDDFLGYMQIQQADLARMDTLQLNALSLNYNTLLAQEGVLQNAGQFSVSKTETYQGGSGIGLSGVGSLIGAGVGALLAAPTGGLSVAAGASLGSSIGGGAGKIGDGYLGA